MLQYSLTLLKSVFTDLCKVKEICNLQISIKLKNTVIYFTYDYKIYYSIL